MVGYFRYPNKPFNLTELARPPWSSKSINPKTKMKNFVLTFLSCTLFTTMLIAQTDCEPYLPTEEGTSWELTHYSAKGKVSGVMQYELLEKTVDGDDMTFKVKATTFDKISKSGKMVNAYNALILADNISNGKITLESNSK